MLKLFFTPSRHLAATIPVMMALGFIAGMLTDVSGLVNYVLIVAVIMIYPTMIGFRLSELANRSHLRLVTTFMLINFVIVPLTAYLLGRVFLWHEPLLFAGLAIASLIPISNMTIAFTLMGKGNVPAAVNLAVIGLVAGALLAPWYLLVMLGQSVEFNVLAVFKTVALVILLPLVLGVTTYSLILRRMSADEFGSRYKPYLAAATPWGMIYIIFTGMGVNSPQIVANPDILLLALFVQALFYAINYTVSITIGRRFFARNDALVLVLASVQRNLSISLGIAATTFGADAALMVAMAFILQGQLSAQFLRMEHRHQFLGPAEPAPVTREAHPPASGAAPAR